MPSKRHSKTTAAAAGPLPPAPGTGEEVPAGEALSSDEGIASPHGDAEMEEVSPVVASSPGGDAAPQPSSTRPRAPGMARSPQGARRRGVRSPRVLSAACRRRPRECFRKPQATKASLRFDSDYKNSAMPPPPGFEEPSLPSAPAEAPPSSAGEHPNPLGCSPVGPEHFPESLGLGHHYEAQDVRENDWELPGAETAPSGYNDRPVTSHWMSGEFILVKVGGKSFRLPMRLLSKYPFWNALMYLERAPQGWSMPGIDPEIFVVLMECVYSTSGLHGTEDGLNLLKLCYAYLLAGKWSMAHDRRKLRDTAYRYVVRKVFFFNPHLAEDQRHLHRGHFRYRSEELYRTWELVRQYPSLEKILSQGDLVSLYTVTIPPALWADLAERFDDLFPRLVEASLERRLSSDQNAFQNWFLRFFRLAGYSDFGWLSRESADRFFGPLHLDDDGNPVPLQFRTEFAAARARNNALVNEYEVRQDQGQPDVSATYAEEDVDAEGEPILGDDLDAEGEPVAEEDVDAEGESLTGDDVLPGPSILSTPTRRSDPERRPRVHHDNRVQFADEPEVFEFEPYQGPSFAASTAAASGYEDMDPMDCDPFVD